jgi:cysteine sulfinate desulfinase/cysteine desulfurase-like protein
MGIEAGRARGAVRLSLGTPTTSSDIERAGKALIAAWQV